MINTRRGLKTRRPWYRTRRGAIVVLAALMMIVFLASVAFSVDVSYMQLTKAKLRSATDAAARAAGEALSRAQNLDDARQAAKDIAHANRVAGEPLLLDEFGRVLDLPGVQVRGLMTMAPLGTDHVSARPYFARLRELQAAARARWPQAEWPELSMGMTDDFEGAIAEGATLVRVGRAIFGERE